MQLRRKCLRRKQRRRLAGTWQVYVAIKSFILGYFDGAVAEDSVVEDLGSVSTSAELRIEDNMALHFKTRVRAKQLVFELLLR